jgi:hypothetical protein
MVRQLTVYKEFRVMQDTRLKAPKIVTTLGHILGATLF